MLLRYPIGATVGEMIPWLLDQESRAKLEQSLDQHSEEVGKVDPAVVAYYQHVLPEAMKLLGFRRLLSLGSRMGIYSVRFRKR